MYKIYLFNIFSFYANFSARRYKKSIYASYIFAKKIIFNLLFVHF